MKTSENGRNLIKSFEGYRSFVYNDNGAPAIGYGHRLLPGESFPNGITPDQADAIQQSDLAKFEAMVNPRVPASCTQNQFDALVSWTYNVQNQPHALDQMLAHGWDQVPVQMVRWCNKKDPTTGQMVEDKGLKARRQKEAALFTS